MFAGVEAADDRVDDAGGTVADVQRRLEALLKRVARGEFCRILVDDQAGVDSN